MRTELTRGREASPEKMSRDRWTKTACDVYENESEWLITADVPGVPKDELSLHLENNELTVEGRRTEWAHNQGFVGYRRTFVLPAGVDGERVVAKLDHGVVAIHLPKSEAMRPRQISVTTG